MKRLLVVLLCMMLLGSVNVAATGLGSQINLEVKIINDTPINPGGPKSPIIIPTVWQYGHELEIEVPHSGYILNVVSGTTVVYSVTVSEDDMVIQLPASLSGEYELQLIRGQFIFYGFIEL